MNELLIRLDEWGEIHVTLESGAKFELHKCDTSVDESGQIIIDSEDGYWAFPASKIESIERPISGPR